MQKIDNTFFLSFEGIEGAGKSTQIQNLKKFLVDELKQDVHIFREPGGTEFGEKLREAMLGAKSDIAPLAQAHLFASSRAQLLSEKIIPLLLREKTWVILDRYIDSSIAYQGKAAGLGIETIIDIHSHYPLNLYPNKTFYLQISVDESLQRQKNRGNNKDFFESKNRKFYEDIKAGLDESAQRFQERFEVINGSMSENEVFEEIKARIKQIANL